MNEYEIITRTGHAKLTFLTRGKNVRRALQNLINRSNDFKYQVENDDSIFNIKIKILK